MAPTLLTLSPLPLITFNKLVEGIVLNSEFGDGWWLNTEINKTWTLSKGDYVYIYHPDEDQIQRFPQMKVRHGTVTFKLGFE